jgi:maltooligosyltrehalose trehalohydrolase
MPTWRLVVSSQNHDQVGNRARGDRPSEVLDDDQLACAALLTLCGPFTPMLFMGEEWAASTPFQFFTSHPEPDLGGATAEGRITEFARMGWDATVVPDPQDPATFERSTLDWDELGRGRHAVLLEVYRELASLRHALPELTDPAFSRLHATADEETRVFTLRRGDVLLAVNFSDRTATLAHTGRLLFTTPSAAVPTVDGFELPPHAGALVRLAT